MTVARRIAGVPRRSAAGGHPPPAAPRIPGHRAPRRRRFALLAGVLAFAAGFTRPASTQENVTVYRDAIGLAHVHADTDEALAYGIGRIHVRDRPLRTLYNLARAAGALTRTVGQLDPRVAPESDRHYRDDRRALRYHREARARWLLAHYRRTAAPDEDRALERLLVAFVRGVNDERVALRPLLTPYFLEHASDIGADLRFTADQYDALFQRPVEAWEPLALYSLVMRSLWEDVIDRHGAAAAPALGRLLPGGSNSFCVPSGGSASGHTFVFADSHQPSEWYVSLRFKARKGRLDGGGFTVSGTPLLLAGFGADVSWAVTLAADHSAELYTYDGDASSSPGSFVNDEGKTVPLQVRTQALPFRLTPRSPLTTISVTDRYLDASEDMPVTGTAAGREGHKHILFTSRFTHGDPRPPTPNDPGCDPYRMLYRLLTARDADDALHRAIGETLSFAGLNVTVADAVRGITLPALRAPQRGHDQPFRSDWSSERAVQHMSGRRRGWAPVDGRLLYPVTALPVVRSDGATPVRDGKPLRFWANCNTTPIWLLGLGRPFGHPDSMAPFDRDHADYVNPFDPAAYLRRPTGLTGMSHFGPPFGSHTLRQEWITMGLKVAWDVGRAGNPPGIREDVLVALIRDTHSPLPHFLALRGFFLDLTSALPAGEARDLAARLEHWARGRLAPHALAPPADAADAARFLVFWEFFRREMPGPWTRAWTRPFAWDFYAPRDHEHVRDGARKAAALTVDVFRRHPDLDLGRLKRYAIPFGGPNVPVPGSVETGFVSQNRWAQPPGSSQPPLIDGGGGGRMPMLIRMRKSGETHHLVRMMMPCQAGRVNTLPEWKAANGPGFHAAPLRWARVEPYETPMTEAALLALRYDAAVTLDYPYRP